ncbi:hypothetical protein [Pseudonocardia sp. NPDC049635]|uniref:hypothetical protein n=1 Tax=Pseudonocardia sp. NPDC049635 TaxID=3155506 RepID=UPI0034034E6A
MHRARLRGRTISHRPYRMHRRGPKGSAVADLACLVLVMVCFGVLALALRGLEKL